ERLGECVTQKVMPHPIGDRAVQVLRVRDEPAQFCAAIALAEVAAALDLCAINEHGIGRLQQAVPQLVEQDRLLRVVILAGEVLIYELHRFNIAAALLELAEGPRLPEEGVELPELLLLPFVERMVVALRALHLQAQEYLRGHRRRLSGAL